MAMNFPSPASPGQIYAPPGGPVYRFDDPVWNAASDLDETWMVTPQMFGGIGNGIADDTAAIHTALASGKAVFFPEGTYKVSQLVIPANTIVRASQLAVIRSDGTSTGSTFIFTLGNNVDFDVLNFSMPSTEASINAMSVGQYVRGGTLRLTCDAPYASTGIVMDGQGQKIDRIETVNLDNAVSIVSPAPTMTTGVDIGFIDVTCYRRAVYVVNTSGRVGGLHARVRSTNPGMATIAPGQNGILLGGTTGFEFGDIWCENAGEHTVRVGGSNGGPFTSNVKFGNITSIKNRGCVFKINPTLLVSPGVTETADNIQVGNILAVDAADGVGEGNREVLRLSHCRNVQIGDVLSVPDEFTFSGQHGLRINDARNVQIASLGGTLNASLVDIDWLSDTDDIATFSGDVIGLRIGRLFGTHLGAVGGNPVTVELGTRNIADIHIHYDGIKDWGSVFYWTSGVITGPIYLTGWINSSIGPGYPNVPNDANIQADITWQGKRYIGRAYSNSNTSLLAVSVPTFTPASASPSNLTISNGMSPVGSGAYGGGIEWTRNTSGRRGAAIVSRQADTSQLHVGLDFFVGDVGVTADEALSLAMRLTYARRVELPALTKYADNAAAVAGGLPVGTLYWTVTGEARIVV